MTMPDEVLVVGVGSDHARIVVSHLAAGGTRVHGPVDVASAPTWLRDPRIDAVLVAAPDTDRAAVLLDGVAGALRAGTIVVTVVDRGLDRVRATALLARGADHVLMGPITGDALIRAFADPTGDARTQSGDVGA